MVKIIALARHHDMPCAPDMRHNLRFPLHIRLHYELEKMTDTFYFCIEFSRVLQIKV